MNPYIGDRELDPPEDPPEDPQETGLEDDCKTCGGFGNVVVAWHHYGEFQPPEPDLEECPDCGGDLEDCMPDLSDDGEPNLYPDEL